MINSLIDYGGLRSDAVAQDVYSGRLPASGRIDLNSEGKENNVSDTFYMSSDKSPDSTGIYSREQILIGNGLVISEEESDASGLSNGDKAQVRELQSRDREVRQHEQTHAGMLGPYARGGPSYVYQVGPDGRPYAIGGSVKVDVGKEATPAATIAKARILRMAATAVDGASSADMAIAASAVAMETATLIA